MALLAALVILALSAALATVTFSASRAIQRASRTTRARARVESGIARAFGEVLAGWSVAQDSLPVGGGVNVALGAEPIEAGPPLLRLARVDRVAERLYAITVELYAFNRERPVARRRARLWLERPAPVAGPPHEISASPIAPIVVTPWAFADLY